MFLDNDRVSVKRLLGKISRYRQNGAGNIRVQLND